MDEKCSSHIICYSIEINNNWFVSKKHLNYLRKIFQYSKRRIFMFFKGITNYFTNKLKFLFSALFNVFTTIIDQDYFLIFSLVLYYSWRTQHNFNYKE